MAVVVQQQEKKPQQQLELVCFSARGVATYPLPPGKHLTVGRGDDVDIVIDDVAVSRKHAVFSAGPPLEVEDLKSANGTFVSPANTAPSLEGSGVSMSKTADQKRLAATARMELGIGDTVHFGAALVIVRAAKGSHASKEKKSDAATWEEDEEGVVIRDAAVVRLYEEAGRAASMSIPVLIVGETGVGKDVLARFIHHKSPRGKAKRPLVALNCAALSEALAESELFGHEKGAFTGAQQARAGLFESADGGTVFLDEIGELPLPTQAKLLRTLENSEVQRVGSNRTIKVDVRFVSATNRDLERASAEGRFRQDLYFRVNGITLRVPPLRERKSEIGVFAQKFLEAASRKMGAAIPPRIEAATLKALEAYAWPGNVRELRYVIERTLVTAPEGPILPEHLPAQVGNPQAAAVGAAVVREELATRERVVDALAQCEGNQTRAAELLGVSRRTLINRMIEFGLPRPRK